jgi:molecular chaperone GrpE
MNDEKDKDLEANAAADDFAETAVLPEDMQADGGTADASETLEEALARAEATAEENWAKYLRAVAELDNVRKRAARDVEKARLYGVEGLAAELLTVADSLEMALETGTVAPAESLLEGGRATLKQLQTAMEKFGVTIVSPEGEPFDPEFHEALSMQESDTAEPDTVLIVVQRGYQLNGRLLRPARVIVAKEPQG